MIPSMARSTPQETSQSSDSAYPPGQAWRELDDIIHKLITEVEKAWKAELNGEWKPFHARDYSAEQALGMVYDKNETLLKELFRLAQTVHQGSDSQAELAPTHQRHLEWHNLDTWMLRNARSRAKVFTIILKCGSEYLISLWPQIMKSIHDFYDHMLDSWIYDSALPIPGAKLKSILGDVCDHEQFEMKQHDFCLVNLEELNESFEDTRAQLGEKIWGKATETYKNTIRADDNQIKFVEKVHWCPLEKLCKVLVDNETLVKKLYYGWRENKHEVGELNDLRAQRKYYDTVKSDGKRVFNGMQGLEKTVGTLIVINAPWRMWSPLFAACLKDSASALGDREKLSNDRLPLDDDSIKDYFKVHDPSLFRKEQFRFCPVDFRSDPSDVNGIEWKHPDVAPRLPLLEKERIGQGGYGDVYKVTVAPGFLSEKEKCLALKEISEVLSNRYTETRVAAKIGSTINPGISVPLQSFRTQNKVYLFMKRADCDLWSLMNNEVDPRSFQEISAKIPEHSRSTVEHEAQVFVRGPKNLEERKVVIYPWLELAKGLDHLHNNLRDERMDPGELIHGDLKADNILYTQSNHRQQFQIADFGIARFRYGRLRGNSSETNGQDLQTSTDDRTRLDLTPGKSNLPPEADDDGKGDSLVDVWQFGLIFAQYVVWMSSGPEGLKDYMKQKTEQAQKRGYPEKNKYTSYYKAENGELRLHESIREWFHKLIETTEHKPHKSFYRNCWIFLEEGLLVCTPENRVLASRLYDTLTGILDTVTAGEIRRRMRSDASEPPRDPSPPHNPIERRKQNANRILHAMKESTLEAAKLISSNTWTGPLDDDLQGNSLLHYSIQYNGCEVTEALLEVCDGTILHERNRSGQTALHLCMMKMRHSRYEHAKFLIEKDPNIVHVEDMHRHTALYLATNDISALGIRREMVRLLVEAIKGTTGRLGSLGQYCARFREELQSE